MIGTFICVYGKKFPVANSDQSTYPATQPMAITAEVACC